MSKRAGRIAVIVLVGVIGFGFALWDIARPELDHAARDVLLNGTDFELISLDYERYRREQSEARERLEKPPYTYLTMPELGSIKALSAVNRRRVVDALADDVRNGLSVRYRCLYPRHAVRVQDTQDVSHAFVNCYECQQIWWYVDGERREIFVIARKSKRLLNELLLEAGIELAPEQSVASGGA